VCVCVCVCIYQSNSVMQLEMNNWHVPTQFLLNLSLRQVLYKSSKANNSRLGESYTLDSKHLVSKDGIFIEKLNSLP
jgi:hypothetical protein